MVGISKSIHSRIRFLCTVEYMSILPVSRWILPAKCERNEFVMFNETSINSITHVCKHFSDINGRLCVQCQWEITSNFADSFRKNHEHYELILYVLINAASGFNRWNQIVNSSSSSLETCFFAGSKCRAAQYTFWRCFTAKSVCRNRNDCVSV